MTKIELDSIWNYYLSLEKDLDKTSRYIEPIGQEDVHSFEFAKLLILACTEVESVLKAICFEIEGKQVAGDIAAYKGTILNKYPKIVESTVIASRLGKNLTPFKEWKNGKLSWWEAYQKVKHNRGEFFNQATYRNVVSAISALYVLIFYLAKITDLTFRDNKSSYIDSQYAHGYLLIGPFESLPDFKE